MRPAPEVELTKSRRSNVHPAETGVTSVGLRVDVPDCVTAQYPIKRGVIAQWPS
jgi:hypothetical protein